MISLTINGETHDLDVPEDMPLLWVLRDVIGMTGTKFGCGISQCGACTVHMDGAAIRSCVTPVSAATGEIETIEAMAEDAVGKNVQQAWLDLGVAQCGYCQAGQIMTATALYRAFPDDPGPPARLVQRGVGGTVTCDRCADFPAPEVLTGRRPAEQIAVMTVPETAVYKNDSAVSGEHEVRAAGEVAAVQTVTEAQRMKSAPQHEFGFRVAAADRRHIAAARGAVVNISQLY